VYRPRRLVDYSPRSRSPFLFFFFLPAPHRRCRVYPPSIAAAIRERERERERATINPAVHFPPASNRILAEDFLDEVRFRVRHAIRVFPDDSSPPPTRRRVYYVVPAVSLCLLRARHYSARSTAA